MACRRYLSGFNELEDVWLFGKILISNDVLPFPSSSHLSVSLRRQLSPCTSIHAERLFNSNGEMLLNDITSDHPITITSENGTSNINLNYDNTLQTTSDGRLSVVPKILLQSDLEMKAQASIKLILDSDVDHDDPIGGNINLDHDNDDFSLTNEGKLKSILPTWKGIGALKVGGVTDVDFLDNFCDGLSDDDLNVPKLKAIRLQTSSDFTQVSGQLSIAPKGLGQIPYYSLDGLSADEGLYYNLVSNTLSTNRILLTTNFVLSSNDVPTQAYVAQFIQAFPGGGIDVLPEIAGTGRQEIKLRCDPSSIFVDGVNNISVRVDPSGGLKKDPAIGLDVRTDPSGSVKVDLGLGLDVRLDPTNVIYNNLGIGLAVRVDPSDGLKVDPGLGLDVRTDPSRSVKVDPALGLDVRLDPVGALVNVPAIGLRWKTDPLSPLFCDLAGPDIRLATMSALSKTTAGLPVMLTPRVLFQKTSLVLT